MYQNIIFDLDGTITKSESGIVNSVCYALEKCKVEVGDKEQLLKFIGPPLLDSFQEFYGFTKEQAELAIKYYREYFEVHGLFENELYEGIDTLLKQLHENGRTILMATSKPEKFAKIILDHFKIVNYFDHVGGATLDGSKSNKDEILAGVLEDCGISDLSTCVMVGDRRFDIAGAKKAGINSIGVTYGYGTYEELKKAGADYIVGSVLELGDYL